MAHIPKPFKRPGIDLSGGVKKSWQAMPASRVRVGDLIKGRGVVSVVEPHPLGVLITSGEFVPTLYADQQSLDIFGEPRDG